MHQYNMTTFAVLQVVYMHVDSKLIIKYIKGLHFII